MKNTAEDRLLSTAEIDIKQIINTLIYSKVLIIIITFIFILFGLVYANSLKPSYNSSAALQVGHFNHAIIEVDIEKALFYNPGIDIIKISDNILLFDSGSKSSPEKVKTSVLNGIEFVLSETNSQIEENIINYTNNLKSTLDDIDLEMASLEIRLAYLENFDVELLNKLTGVELVLTNPIAIASNLDLLNSIVNLSTQKGNILVEQHLLQSRQSSLIEQLKNPNKFFISKPSNIIKEPSISESPPNRRFYVILSGIMGLVISIFIALIKSAYRKS